MSCYKQVDAKKGCYTIEELRTMAQDEGIELFFDDFINFDITVKINGAIEFCYREKDIEAFGYYHDEEKRFEVCLGSFKTFHTKEQINVAQNAFKLLNKYITN